VSIFDIRKATEEDEYSIDNIIRQYRSKYEIHFGEFIL